MNCRGCGNEKAFNIRTVYEQGEVFDSCDRCTGVRCEGVPDVYFSGRAQKFQNLCDDMGRPIEITSKRQKLEVMKKLGVSEVGDRVNGAPFGTRNWIEGTREHSRKSFDKDRPMIRKLQQQYLENVRKRNGR